MLKTPEQILEETKKWFEETKNKWNNHLSGKEKNYILGIREMDDPQVIEEVKIVLVLIDEALEKDTIEGWKEFYEKWNGDPDYMNEDKYDGNKDLIGRLSDLQNFLVEWERVSHEQSQQRLIEKSQNILQTIGINPNDENAPEKAEELKKVQTDLTDLGIDNSNVKETIENERDEYKAKDQWLIDNYFEENIWEKIKAQIEVKKNLKFIENNI